MAEIVEGSPPPIGDAVINDGPGLLLIVEKHPWGNTLDVTHKVEAALESAQAGPEGRPRRSHDLPAGDVHRAVDHEPDRTPCSIGCGLVVVILVAFLFDWRTALISLTAIPLSLLAASTALYYSGASINTMVLAGLVIALGEVVDDAIIDVENIARRLRLNRSLPNPEPAFRVVLNASLEVRSAVVYATLIVVLVFVPVFFMDGLSGTFFRPLAKAYVLAILASLLVALTVTPALSPHAARRPDATSGRRPPLTRWLKRHYRAVLPALVARPWAAIAFLVVAFAVSGARDADVWGRSSCRTSRRRDFLMHWVEKPGTGDRGQPPDHRPGEQGAAADPRRAQLRVAHRPGRGRRRSRRPELHRAVDQHRRGRRLRSRRSRRSKTSSTATPACTATCRPT